MLDKKQVDRCVRCDAPLMYQDQELNNTDELSGIIQLGFCPNSICTRYGLVVIDDLRKPQDLVMD